MDPDNFQHAWQSHASHVRVTIDAELLLTEVRRNEQYFTAILFWRDVREVGTSLLLAPLWIYLGVKLALPWAWHLTAPVLVWIAAFMLVDRLRHRRQPPATGEPLRQRVADLLRQVEHQIWLLRSVFWWCLLPLALSMLAFIGQISWHRRSDGWLTVLAMGTVVAVISIIFAAVYWLNQHAVRTSLQPRRQELQSLLASLTDEPPAAK